MIKVGTWGNALKYIHEKCGDDVGNQDGEKAPVGYHPLTRRETGKPHVEHGDAHLDESDRNEEDQLTHTSEL